MVGCSSHPGGAQTAGCTAHRETQLSEQAKDNAALIEELLKMTDKFLDRMTALEAENQDLRQQLVRSGSQPIIMATEPAKVLLVDPQGTETTEILGMLANRGYKAEPVKSAKEAQERADSVDLVVVNSQVEDEGLALIQALRETAPQTDVLVIVGFTSADTAVQALRLGAAGFLIRPVSEKDLGRQVSELVQQRLLKQRSQQHIKNFREQYKKLVEDYRESQ